MAAYHLRVQLAGLVVDDLQIRQRKYFLIDNLLYHALFLAIQDAFDEGVLGREGDLVLLDVFDEEVESAVDGQEEELLLDFVLGKRDEIDFVEVGNVDLQEGVTQR
jgi:hypothetical protein